MSAAEEERRRPALVALAIGDPAEVWEELGFTVRDGVLALDGVELRLGATGRGIVAWSLAGIAPAAEIAGLVTHVEDVVEKPTICVGFSTTSAAAEALADGSPAAGALAHPNGAVALDHVVVTTEDFDRTARELEAHGMPLRRVREVAASEARPAFRQGFRRLGPAILELVEAPGAPPGPARFWGLTMTVRDLDALAARLGDRLSPVRPAVQPGRHIATLRREAGVSMAVAFMDPENPHGGRPRD